RMLGLSFARRREMKLGRKHADDCVSHVIQGEGLAKNISLSAKMAAIKGVRDDCDVGLRRIGCGRVEARADCRLHPEKGEDVRRSPRAFDPFRFRTTR